MGEAPAVGIDLGSTHCKVAVLEGGALTLVEDETTQRGPRATIPSIVALSPEDRWLVGDAARELLWQDASRAVPFIKRLLGLDLSSGSEEAWLSSLAVTSEIDEAGELFFKLGPKRLSPADAASHLLRHLAEQATAQLGQEVTRAVLTVPCGISEPSRQALELAARRAGLEVLGVVSEPVAAAMGCGFSGERDAVVAVYDFGGSTFDATFLQVSKERSVVLGSATDPTLGGADIDVALAHLVAAACHAASGYTPAEKVEEFQRLISACEEAKRWLSSLEEVDILVPCETDGELPTSRMLAVPVARHQLDPLLRSFAERSLKTCEAAAQEAGVAPREVDALIITGGSAGLWRIRQVAEEYFGQEGIVGVYPEHAAVAGAALQAAAISGMAVPSQLGSRLRARGALGRHVGLVLNDGSIEPLILADEHTPVTSYRLFCTSKDDQTACKLQLAEGNGANDTSAGARLGVFIIDGLPPRKAGETRLDVYFELTSTGTLCVTAQDRGSGHRAQGYFKVDISR